MSLERRLIVSVFVVLMASLSVAAIITYAHAVAKVRTELLSAMGVGLKTAQDAVQDGTQQRDPVLRMQQIVADFDGDRHLRAHLERPDGQLILASTVKPPNHPAPTAFADLVSGQPLTANVDLPAPLGALGRLQIRTDAANEVAEAWSDFELTLFVMGVFFCLVLGLTVLTLRASLRPIRNLCDSLTRIGSGDYGARLAWPKYRELQPVQQGFNAMAARLADMERQNRILAMRMQCLQEDDRAELARDLHDDVAPFLFAVSADAALIRQFARAGNIERIEARAAGILDSAGHMQKHLHGVLSRLMPDVLLDLGLPGAVDAHVHFWKSRRPDIVFQVDVTGERLGDRTAAVALRVVQESLSNAVRHGHPTLVSIAVTSNADNVEIEITDDGRGLPDKISLSGLGLLGMRERVRSIGGVFEIANRLGAPGVTVHAVLTQDAMLAAV